MRNTMIFLICLVFISVIQAEINDVHLVVNTSENETLLYDHDTGICQQGDNIYMAYYLRDFDEDNLYFVLRISISTDGGNEFIEHDLLELTLNPGYQPYFAYGTHLPSVWVDETGMIFVFYLDLVTAKAMVATSNDSGETFSFQPITGMPGRNQYKVISTEDGLLIGAMGSKDKIPLSRFQYLTQYEESENLESYDPDDHSSDVLFHGAEVMEGITASDDDIWIRQVGGGSNDGWPTFEQRVISSGRIMDGSTGTYAVNSAPMDDIFLGGYIEQAAHFLYPSEAEAIRANGIILEESSEYDVLLAQIEGNIAHLRYANYVTQIDTFIVYNSFPDPAHPDLVVGDSIWTNEITARELVWEEETTDLEVSDTSVFVNCQLWIEGNIGSNMTWGCADTVYITSDISYADIEMGDPAEDSQYMFGLVSEERMLIKYKYRDFNGIIHDDNCSSVYLYGSYAALGDGDFDLYGDMNTHYEGIFSFEYQHPHGSTPGFSFELPSGETWDVPYPDLQKFIFPPNPYWSGDPGFQFHGNDPVANNGFYTCGCPYENPLYGDSVTPPYGADYPWYNPVYPEAACFEMGERGIIQHYGGIQQRRFGYTHRSGTDPNNHSGNEWDIDHWQYSGTHGSLGYTQHFHWDTRMDSIAPPDYPEIDVLLGSYPGMIDFSLYHFDPATLSVEQIDHFESDLQFYIFMLDFCQSGNDIAFLTDYEYENSQIIVRKNEQWSVIVLDQLYWANSLEIWGDFFILKGDDEIFVLDDQGNQLALPDLNQFSNNADYLPEYEGLLFTVTGESPLYQFDVRQVGDIPVLGSYNFSFSDETYPYNSSLEISLPDAEHLLMQIVEEPTNSWRLATKYIYLATGDISDILTGTIADEIMFSPHLECYPNPFNPDVNLSFSLAQPGFVEITIYNIKGQIVDQVISSDYTSGTHSITWQPLSGSSGIYLAQYKLDHKIISNQKLTLLK
jgi:Secretion system C-terminal sorting domain